MEAIIAIVVVVVILAIVLIALYNNLVQLRNRVDNAWSQIDVQLQRRLDLIPNLVETVKGYAAHESGTLQKVTEARSAVCNATTPEQKMAADNFLSGTLKSLFAVSEAYPELKANANFQQLQSQLADTEDKISYMRQSFNDTVMKYNTAIAQMMTLVNEMVSVGSVTRGELKTLLLLLNPVAPHITEEMWENQGFGGTMTYQKWPTWDEDALVKSEIEIAVQVCGKVRGRVMIPADMTKERAETELQQLPEIQKILAGKTVTKVIFVPGRLVNFIAK